jgi:tetratricopeptide (TPR) repeat protein
MRKACLSFAGLLIFVLSSATVLHAQGDAYERGRRAYLSKDYGTAMKYLKEYVVAKPDARGYYLLGYASYESNRRSGHGRSRKDILRDDEAIKYFGEAYRIDPDFSPQALFNK